MTKKLTLFFIVGISALILFLTYTNSAHKAAKKLPVSAFPKGDFYGSMETKEIIRIIRAIQDDSLVESFPFSLSMIEGFLNTLQESGIDPSTVYLVANSMQSSVHLFLTINDAKKANEYLNEYAFLFDFKTDSINNTVRYSYDQLQFSTDDNWLTIKYTDTQFFEAFQVPVPLSIHPIDPSVFENKNSFHYSSSFTDSLGIQKFVLTQANKANDFQWLIQVEAIGLFPFEFSSAPFNSHTFGSYSNRISVSVQLTDDVSHPIRKKLSKLFTDYNLNERNILANWSGDLTYETGPDVELIDTIITTTFDENFNPVEEYRIRRKMKPSFLLFLGSETPKDLIKGLNKNNFFQTRNALTRLPNGGLTNTIIDETGLLFTTLNAQATQPMQSFENKIQFTWNELRIQLTLEKSSSKELEFLLKVLLPSQVEHGEVEKIN
jgi:hypothetical protein